MLNDQRLIFMHVEKTAGSTVYGALEGLFADGTVCPERHEQIALLPAKLLANYQFFAAHATMQDFIDIPRPALLMTFLRDPTERTLSLYDFWRSFPSHRVEAENLYGPRLARTLSPEEFFKPSNNWRTHATNRYTEVLLGQITSRSGEELLTDPQERAEAAIKILNRFDFVGITEAMQDSVDRLAILLDIPQIIASDSINVTNRNHESSPNDYDPISPAAISQSILSLIDQCNASDRIIYEHAVSMMFPNNNLIRKFELQEICNVRKRNGRYTKWYVRDNPGMVLHGPYIRLRPGNYIVSFFVNATRILQPDAQISLDVVCSRGGDVIITRKVCADEIRNGRIDLGFELLNFANDLEFRIVDLIGGIECSGSVELVMQKS